MDATRRTNGSAEKPLWRFVQIDEFKPPSAGLDVHAVRSSVFGVFRGLVRKKQKIASPLDDDQDLHSLSESELDSVVPTPAWADAAGIFHDHLGNWLGKKTATKPVIFFVGPPYGGRTEALDALVARDGFSAVPPPVAKTITAGDERWFRRWPKTGVWVMPRLEKCFVRRADGLNLVRELLARAVSGELGQGVIGCDSWAWEFLRHVWPGRPSFTETLQAFGAEDLDTFFQARHDDRPMPRFRLSDSGLHVIASSLEGLNSETASSEFLEQLSAHSRGNIGIAREIWRRSLRLVPERDPKKKRDDNVELDEDGQTVWVTPWDKIERPDLPSEADHTEARTLHALLLHDGLSNHDLASILPGSRADVAETLLFLAEAGLVGEYDEEWRVTPLGYPSVRAFLRLNDYLVDAF